jgi:hypothetical protein
MQRTTCFPGIMEMSEEMFNIVICRQINDGTIFVLDH